MLFRFYKYIQPTHYFSKKREDGRSIFPKANEVPNIFLEHLVEDDQYQSSQAIQYDLSWQLLQKGYIKSTPVYETIDRLPIKDEYRFLKKYFSPIWSYYVLFLRIFTLKKPWAEIPAFFQAKKVSRTNYFKNPIQYPTWNDFKSELLASKPLVSVIIPTLNRYEYLKDVIADLEAQDYPNFEIIIVDQTSPFNEEFYKQFKKPLRVYYQEEKALWLARNFAIKQSKGDLYLLFDDDSRIEKDWISNHVKCIDFFKAHISSGTSISKVGSKVPENYSFFRVSDQLDTGNVLIKKEVFEKVGLFDRQFEKQRMGDGEFGLRACLAGFLNISNPYAERLHLKVSKGGLRQMGSWDGFRPKSWLAPRPIPSVLYYFRKYHGNRRSILAVFKSVPPSLIPYRFKKNKLLLALGTPLVILLFPIVLAQVFRSWNLASRKLKEGDKIDYI